MCNNTEDKTFSSALIIILLKVLNLRMICLVNWWLWNDLGKIEKARLYCRRLYRYFVSPNITNEIESDIIIPLAQQLKDSDYVTEGIIIAY